MFFIVTGLPIVDSTGSRIFGIVDPKERVAILSEDRLISDPKLDKRKNNERSCPSYRPFLGFGTLLKSNMYNEPC